MTNELMLRDIRSQRQALEEGRPTLRAAAAGLAGRTYRRVIISGSGDSYIAAVAIESLFQHHLDVAVQALPALDASRSRLPQAGDLTVVISISGEVSRAVELARSASSAGATVVGVTAASDSTLAQSCDVVLTTPQPIDRSIPHSRDYSVTLLALACVLEALCQREFSEVDALSDVVGAAIPVALEQTSDLATPVGTRTWFLGAGPDRGTAMYGSMKYWEAAGLESWWDDLEEFGHGSQLMARPGDRAVLIAAGGAAGRAIEMTAGLERMGLDIVLVGGSEFESVGVTHLVTNDDVSPLWHPFIAAIPLQALTYAEAESRGLDVSVVLDGQKHGPVYDDVHGEWTKRSQIMLTGPDNSP